MKSIRKQAITGILWNFIEKLSIRLGQFVISIILARLLQPSDFGLIAIIMFFLNLSQVLIEGGLPRALIQKNDRTEEDYSSVFVANLSLSLLLYSILFVTAPLISSLYSNPQLIPLIRVLSITLVLNSLVLVPNVMLQVLVDFKKLAKINLISLFVSGAAGIVCAVYGLAVWALVCQYLVFSVINGLLLMFAVKLRKPFCFSFERLKVLWRFAINLMVAGVLAQISNNIYNLLIGKYYSVKSLGCYHRANSFTVLASETVTQAIQEVTYPVLSKMQHEKDRMVAAFVIVMKMSAFVIFPVMTLLSVMADPIVRILLNDDWLPVIPLLQWMAFSRLLYPLHAINLNILNATGRSGLFLKLDVLKLPITILALVITLPMGIKAIVIGQVLCSPLFYAVNTIMSGRLYNYHLFKQVKDVFPYAVATIVLYVVSALCLNLFESSYLQLIVGSSIGLLTYLVTCRILKVEALYEIVNIIQGVRKKNI